MTAVRHPVLWAVGAAAFQFLLAIGLLFGGKMLLPPDRFGFAKVIVFASTILIPILFAHFLRLWPQTGIKRLRFTPFALASFAVCLPFFWLGMGILSLSAAAGTIAMQAANAFGEELLFRGVIFALLLRLPLARAILLNALLFGAMHLIHGVMDGDWPTALFQAAMTAVAGALFAAVRAETGSLWTAILLHMALNLSVIFAGPDNHALVGRLTGPELAEKAIEIAFVLWFLLRTSGKHGSFKNVH